MHLQRFCYILYLSLFLPLFCHFIFVYLYYIRKHISGNGVANFSFPHLPSEISSAGISINVTRTTGNNSHLPSSECVLIQRRRYARSLVWYCFKGFQFWGIRKVVFHVWNPSLRPSSCVTK